MKDKQKVAILTTGLLPVPSVLGGAVESLTQNFIDENERQRKVHLTIYSSYTPEAITKSKKYRMAEFKFVKTPELILLLDLAIYHALKTVFKAKRAASARAILQRAHFMWRVSRDISRRDYDRVLFENAIVQMHAMGMYGNWRKYKGKVYLHVHNELASFFGARSHLCRARIITVSNFVATMLVNKLHTSRICTDDLSINTLRNAVDNKKFQEIEKEQASRYIRSKYSIDANKKIILFSGRLTPDKGVDALIRSLEYVKSDNFILLIVGSSFFGTDVRSPFLKELDRIAKPHLEKLRFTGYIDYSDMPKIYRGSDFAVLPSNCNDAAPLTIIESVTSHLPIITTNRGGIPEYVNEKSAIILQTNTGLESALAESIDKLVSDPAKLKDMQKAEIELSKSMTLEGYYSGLLARLEIK